MNVHPICSNCGGKNIELRTCGEVRWDAEAGTWAEFELSWLDYYEYCLTCGGDYPMHWVDRETYDKAHSLEMGDPE